MLIITTSTNYSYPKTKPQLKMATYFCVTSTQFYGEFDNDVTKIVHRKVAVNVFFKDLAAYSDYISRG